MHRVLQAWWQRQDFRVLGVTFTAALLALFFFAPRFVYWRARGTSITTAEVARVRAAELQLAHPLVRLDDHTNRVSQWRLFFPVAGRALHLPPNVFLALPHLGCLLVLGFAAWITQRHGLTPAHSLAATLLIATSSWYFVSSGWLAYFDAYYVLGLLVVTFAPSRRWAIAAVLITPWIDERFVLTLPLVLLWRAIFFAAFPIAESRSPGDSRTAGWLLIALLPWAAIRLGVFIAGVDPATRPYLADLPAHQRAIPASHFLLGAWHGIRCAWLFVAAGLVLAHRETRRLSPWLWTAFFLTVIVNLGVAEDLSRSISTLIPGALLGLLLWWKHQPASQRLLIPLACGLNLLLPARHVSAGETWPVRYLYAELDRLRDPPRAVDPRYYNEQAVAANQRGEAQQAFNLLTLALALEADFAEARADRAVIAFRGGQRELGLQEIEISLARYPQNAGFLHSRGNMRAETGNVAGAIADLESALRTAPAAWPLRTAVEQQLITLRQQPRKS